MKKFIKEIEKTDVFTFIGLVSLGVGLYLCAGIGVSLSVSGSILFCMGYFAGAVKVKK